MIRLEMDDKQFLQLLKLLTEYENEELPEEFVKLKQLLLEKLEKLNKREAYSRSLSKKI